VKGATQNQLLGMGFKAAYMFRPGFIQPMHGIRSRTPSYNVIYAVLGPLYPLLKAVVPAFITNTEVLGRAMLRVARDGAETRLIEQRDINRLGA